MLDKLANIIKFKSQCPFLGRTKTSTLRTLYTSKSARYPSLNCLTEKATKCPVMGPVLAMRSSQIAAGYASVAVNVDVKTMHEQQGVKLPEGVANIEKCPHASAALAAARTAKELADAKMSKAGAAPAVASGCPFHAPPTPNVESTSVEPKVAPNPEHFDYEGFYDAELQKKHGDKSYRYFNNINRMAAKFPIAHTGKVQDEVTVWCANDYLGMGNNPVVLETIK
jgi:5-aminolevulinate synthase